jgi:fibronectin-binding autotransporter adhesin
MRLARSSGVFWVLILLLSAFPGVAGAQTTWPAASYDDLRRLLAPVPPEVGASPGDTITFTQNITLTGELPSVPLDLTIDGGGFTLSGGNQYRGFVLGDAAASQGVSPTVVIQNLTIANTVATGGAGGSGVDEGGGGGAGLGGAIFIAAGADVTLVRVSIVSSSAVGGAGGDSNGIGAPTGGSSVAPVPGSFGWGSEGGDAIGGDGGGVQSLILNTPPPGTVANFGSGGGAVSGGGGGAFGGAIFVQGDPYGGSWGWLRIGDGVSINGSSVTGGAGGAGAGNGGTAGAGIFLHSGNGFLIFDLAAGTTTVISDPIADIVGASSVGAAEADATLIGWWSLIKAGEGRLVLGGDNLYSNGTTVLAGTLSVNSDRNLGLSQATPLLCFFGCPDSSLALGGTSTLEITGSNVFNRELRLSGAPTISVGSGVAATWSGEIWGTAGLHLTGGGALTVSNSINSYSGGTVVTGGSTVLVTADAQGADSALGSGGLTLGDAVSSGTLGLAAGASLVTTRAIRLEAGGGRFDTGAGSVLELGEVVSGPGSLTKIGAGTLFVAVATSHTGGTTIDAGTLRAGLTDVFPTTSLSIAGSATFDLNGFDQTLGSLAGAGEVLLGSAALTTGGNDASTAFSGGISGTGGLVKDGAGMLTLTGANSYTGGTTVSGGILSGTTTSLQGAIVNHARVTFSQGFDGTYAGGMSGSGSLTKDGAGTLTLTGANSYTGGTTITGGTLVGNTASLQGNILNHGAILFNQGAAGTYSGVISGTGTFSKSGAGTLTLAASSTFTGTAAIEAGTLRAGATNVFGPSTPVSVASGATFDLNGFNQSIGTLWGGGNVALGSATLTTGSDDGSALLSGVISGTGGLVKDGAGMLTLTGANSYTGGTTVSGGILSGTTTSLQGHIVNNARVTFSQGFDGTYAGGMSGTGSLTKDGAGTLTLTGANSYTGGTTITGGTLVGNTVSLQGNILNHGAILFNQAVAGTYSGVISGTGTFSKTGAGTLTLAASSTFTGAAAIDAGTLRAGAANLFGPSTPVSVASGATFDLNGFNQSIGTLSGGGNFALGSATLTTGG